jgi:hypothetical protein
MQGSNYWEGCMKVTQGFCLWISTCTVYVPPPYKVIFLNCFFWVSITLEIANIFYWSLVDPQGAPPPQCLQTTQIWFSDQILLVWAISAARDLKAYFLPRSIIQKKRLWGCSDPCWRWHKLSAMKLFHLQEWECMMCIGFADSCPMCSPPTILTYKYCSPGTAEMPCCWIQDFG